MNKTFSVIFTIILVLGIGFILTRGSPTKTNNTTTAVPNSEIKNGIQYITINARGGYSPHYSVAQAGMETKLIIKTNGTYDCSLSLVIPSINYKKILAKTGEEIIDIGTPKINESLIGVCAMGMYSFSITFK